MCVCSAEDKVYGLLLTVGTLIGIKVNTHSASVLLSAWSHILYTVSYNILMNVLAIYKCKEV